MKRKSQIYTMLAMMFIAVRVSAQVGINTDNSTPDASAMLDVKSTNKGILIPRVALTYGALASFPITNPAIGLLVYNTITTGLDFNKVVPGYYCWFGARWVPVIAPQGTNAGDMLYWDGWQWVKLPAGSSGQTLVLTNSIPTWTPAVQSPSVITNAATEVTPASASCGGCISDGGTIITAKGICWNTAPTPTLANSYLAAGSGSDCFSSPMTGLVSNTVYYVRAYATNSVGTSYGNEISFTTPSGTGCGIAASHAYKDGISPANTSPYTGTYSYSTVMANASWGLGGGKCWITRNLGSSAQATSGTDADAGHAGWYFQFNRKQGYSHDGTNRTPGAAWITSISENSDWTAANDPCTQLLGAGWRIPTGVEWSGFRAASVASGGMNNGGVTEAFNSGLKLHSAGYIYNIGGTLFQRGDAGVFWGNTQSTVTDGSKLQIVGSISSVSIAPKSWGISLRCLKDPGISLNTGAVTNITATTATATGEVTSDGGSPVTARGICYSTTESPTLAGSTVAGGSGLGNFTASLTGLTAGSTYYVRAYATNASGTSYGNQVSFTTAGLVTPATVVTTVPHDITGISAVSGGFITDNGGATVTARGVCWSILPGPTISNAHSFEGYGTGPFSSNLTGLSPDQTIYLRAYATNSAGTSYGNEVNFTTLNGQISLTTTAPLNVSKNTENGGGIICDDGGIPITARGVCWNTSPTPSIASNHTHDGTGEGVFSSYMTGLTPNSLYYARAYATNSQGTYYGDQVSFTTNEFDIGQSYGGGIIFYLDSTEHHGLIAPTLEDLNGPPTVFLPYEAIPRSYSTDFGSGQTNTTMIVTDFPNLNSAARLCDTLTLNGYDDWFLPSRDELNEMHLKQNYFEGIEGFSYWSSSNGFLLFWEAYIVIFDHRGISVTANYHEAFVRCVRAF